MSDKPQDESNKGTEWTPDKINSVLKGVLPLVEKYLSFKDNEAKHAVLS